MYIENNINSNIEDLELTKADREIKTVQPIINKWVSEFTLGSGESKTFNLQTEYPSLVNLYSNFVNLKVKDPIVTSPLYNTFINSEAVSTYSVSGNSVSVYNDYSTPLYFCLTVLIVS